MDRVGKSAQPDSLPAMPVGSRYREGVVEGAKLRRGVCVCMCVRAHASVCVVCGACACVCVRVCMCTRAYVLGRLVSLVEH